MYGNRYITYKSKATYLTKPDTYFEQNGLKNWCLYLILNMNSFEKHFNAYLSYNVSTYYNIYKLLIRKELITTFNTVP